MAPHLPGRDTENPQNMRKPTSAIKPAGLLAPVGDGVSEPETHPELQSHNTAGGLPGIVKIF